MFELPGRSGAGFDGTLFTGGRQVLLLTGGRQLLTGGAGGAITPGRCAGRIGATTGRTTVPGYHPPPFHNP